MTPAPALLTRSTIEASESVSLFTEMETPFTVNDPVTTGSNLVVFDSTCRSSRTLPRSVLLVLSFAAVRKPVVSLLTTIWSSLAALVTISILLVVELKLAVTPAPEPLIFARTLFSESVSLLTAMVTPLIWNDPVVTLPNRDVIARACWSSRTSPLV